MGGSLQVTRHFVDMDFLKTPGQTLFFAKLFSHGIVDGWTNHFLYIGKFQLGYMVGR